MNEIDWQDLRLLLSFSEGGTLQEAAKIHGITPSTVSRRIRSLEERVGVRLVENVSGHLVVTPQGDDALTAARAMKDHSDAWLRRMAGQTAEPEGELRIGVLDIMIRMHRDLFDAFARAYPQVSLVLLSQPRVHNLNRREVDAVLRASRAPDATLVGRRVLEYEYAVFANATLAKAAKTHAKTAKTAKTNVEFAALPWIAWSDALDAVISREWMRANVPDGQIRARVTSASAMLDLTAAGVGASILPIRYGNAAGLHPLTERLPGFETFLWFLTHRDLASSAPVRAFSEHVRKWMPDGPSRRMSS